MEFEDGLIIGVALVIGLNRAFIGTALKRSRAAYVFIQAFDVGACFALFFARVFPDPRLDYAIRVFLMLFVAWHMVQNYIMRAALRAPTPREAEELAQARKEIEAQIAREREEEERERSLAAPDAIADEPAPEGPTAD
ncbi:MAG: hypothetical protein KDA24_11050 [Deltaproteobacteria bacterium]|nr:hypothetical protein [Deltaproteobacteria bacterium]